MAVVAAACAILAVVTTLIHYEALRLTSAALPRLQVPAKTKLLVAILVVFVAHLLEIALYAGAYYLLPRGFEVGTIGDDAEPSAAVCAYLSAQTYTSLGYGDVQPHGPLRLLAGIEALNGLLLIGWSASFIFVAMERFWKVKAGGEPAASRSDDGKRD